MAKIEIPQVAFELHDDGTALIEQDHGGERHFVALHPVHVHALCAEVERPLVKRLIGQLVFLRNGISDLHEDLASQVGYPGRVRIPEADDSEALLRVADLFLDEMGVPRVETEIEPKANPAQTRGKPSWNPRETQPVLPGIVTTTPEATS